jgi:hypothetical protein
MTVADPVSGKLSNLRVFGGLGQYTVQDSKALQNLVGCGFVLGVLLFIRTNKDRERKTYFFIATKSLSDLPPSHEILYKLLACHKWGPRPWPTSAMP